MSAIYLVIWAVAATVCSAQHAQVEHAALVPCDNYIVDNIPGGKDAVAKAADSYRRWMQERTGETIAPFAGKWKFEFDRLNITHYEVPKCSDFVRYGVDYDEQKFFCSPPHKRKSCVAYSIGGNNKWEYEEAMFADTDCRIHTFDCTCDGLIPDTIKERTKFHKKCWGSNPDRPEDFVDFQSMLQISGEVAVDYLKIDIEGYEWLVLHQLAAAAAHSATSDNELPLQMFIELHLDRDFGPNRRAHIGEKLLHFFDRLFSVGYMIMFDRITVQTRNHDVLLSKVLCRPNAN